MSPQQQRLFGFFLLAGAGWLLTSNAALAVPRTWTRATGGAYFSPNNWTPTGVPSAGDDIRFGLASPTQEDITLLQNRTASNLLITSGNLRFAGIGINEFNLDSAVIEEPAQLTIEGVTRNYDFNLSGELDVEGDFSILGGSRLTSGVGRIEGVGAARASVTVSGEDSMEEPTSWDVADLVIGANAGGDLLVENGAAVRSGGLSLGRGEFVVSGAGLGGNPSDVSINGIAEIGLRSESQLRVLGGGQLTTGNTGVGIAGVDAATVELSGTGASGVGSRWNINGFLAVDNGDIRVSDGAMLTTGDARVQRGVLQVTDPGSLWIVSGLLAANTSQGVTVSNDARIASDSVEIGNASTGQLIVDGGIWTNAGDAFVGGSEFGGNNGSGTLRVSNGFAAVGGGITVWESGRVVLENAGRLFADRIDHTQGGRFDFLAGELGVDRFEGDLVNQGGVLAPGGVGIGATSLLGDYAQGADATLAIDIRGLTPSASHDVVNISGGVDLDGLLALNLSGGFIPAADDLFTILAADSLVGFFDNVVTGQRIDTVDGAGSFIVHYGVGSAFDESRVVLSDFLPVVALPGDYNADGIVDALDYLAFRDNLGAPAGTLPNDVDGGLIGGQQYETLLANFGAFSPSPSPFLVAKSAAVPEPTTLGLLFIGAALFSRRRCRS